MPFEAEEIESILGLLDLLTSSGTKFHRLRQSSLLMVRSLKKFVQM
jgi:hypothetical protein